MFENIINFFKKLTKKENQVSNSKDAAKERLHLVLLQDRANVSADFLDLMKQEIIEVIKKYIEIDEAAIDVRLTNKENGDGTNGAPALYANIPIVNIKEETRKISDKEDKPKENKQDKKENKDKEEKISEVEVKIEENKKEEVSEETKNKKEELEENKVEEKTQKEESEENKGKEENKDSQTDN